MLIKSPVTNSGNTIKIGEINVDDIINAYKEIGIDKHVEKYFFGINKIDIYKCCDTGYRFYYPFTIFGNDEFYSYLQSKRKYYSDWRWEHGVAYEQIQLNANVLEMGCGTGNFLKKIKEGRRAKVVGLDFNKEAIKEAKNKGLKVFNQTIEEHSKENSCKYDVVCCFQVLEHVWDVKKFLDSSLKCLKDGGLFIVGVPNNNPYLFRHDILHALNLPPHHAGLWDEKSLENIKSFQNINIIKIEVEPLEGADIFWQVQQQHWKNNNKLVYSMSKLIPEKLNYARNLILKKIFKGRNIIAIYRKNEKK